MFRLIIDLSFGCVPSANCKECNSLLSETAKLNKVVIHNGGRVLDERLQDIQRFFDIYERNLDRYALSSQAGDRLLVFACRKGAKAGSL